MKLSPSEFFLLWHCLLKSQHFSVSFAFKMEVSPSRRLSTISTISAISDGDENAKPGASQQAHNNCDDSGTYASSIHTTIMTSHRQEPSEIAPFIFNFDQNTSNEHEKEQAVDTKLLRNELKETTWLPLTLRLPYLSFLFALSLFLGVLVLSLTMYSNRNHGLGNDNDSSILLFGWRFSPTLVATIYGLLVASLLTDVRRTEIFAQLSKPGGASGENTLCFPSRSWWNDPIDALSKDRRSWALFVTSVLYILALVISPLSAGLLSPANIQMTQSIDFKKAKVKNFAWPQDMEDLIMFRTISGAVLDQSTSAWLTKSAAVLPFWRSDVASAPSGSKFTTDLDSEQWQAQTVAYSVDLDCQPMDLVAQYNRTDNETRNDPFDYTFFKLQSRDGCVITLTDFWTYSDVELSTNGGGSWAGSSDYNISRDGAVYTSACGNRTMFFANSAMQPGEPLKIQAHLCSESFYAAEVLATVSMTHSSTIVAFNPDEYLQTRQPLDPLIYNVSQLQEAFLSRNWSAHFLDEIDPSAPQFAGPLASIAASKKYNNNPNSLLASSDLLQEATELYQQF